MIFDAFGGPGGWDVALAALGRDDVIGLEYDRDTCATRAAAGFTTIRVDVAQFPIGHIRPGTVEGVIASPPCPMFSSAGKGAGRAVVNELCDAIADELAQAGRLEWHTEQIRQRILRDLLLEFDRDDAYRRAAEYAQEAALTVQPARFIAHLQPEWIAMEQVPAVLPMWREYVHQLRGMGYSAWCGILNAADFGVPQTRRRAILMASTRVHVEPPAPTHGRGGVETLFGSLPPWVSMAAALGWGMTERPSTTLVSGSSRTGGDAPLDGGSGARAVFQRERERGAWLEDREDVRVGFPRKDDRGESADGYRERDWREANEPAFAITEKARSWTVSTGMNSMKHSRDIEDMVPFERSVDEPAPTVDTMSGWKWQIGPEGHRQPPHRFKVEVRRGPRPGDEPGDNLEEGFYTDEPSQTVTSKVNRWQVSPDLEDEWVHESADPDWPQHRPATMIAGDSRVFPPGGHMANDGRDNTKMVGRSENTIRLTVDQAATLQSFPDAFPWQGSRSSQFAQVGNAVPCLLAWHVLGKLLTS